MADCEQAVITEKGKRTTTKDAQQNIFDSFFKILEEVNEDRQLRTGRGDDGSSSESSGDSTSEDSADDESAQEIVEQPSEIDLHSELAGLNISKETNTLEALILIAEFYIKNGDVEGFRQNMRRPDQYLMTSERPVIDEVISRAENFVRINLPFRAVMMYKCASTLYRYSYVRHDDDIKPGDVTPDDAIIGIETCIRKVVALFQLIYHENDHAMYHPHFVPVTYDMLTSLREIRRANRKLKYEYEAWALLQLSFLHGRLNEWTEMDDVSQTAITKMEKRFKRKAYRRQVYGLSLLMLSISKAHKGDFSGCNEASEKGLKAFQDADGFPSWDAKLEMVKKAQNLQEEILRIAK